MSLHSFLPRIVLTAITPLVVGGCAMLPGHSEFKCQAPDGIPCMSVEDAYRRSLGAAPAITATTADGKKADPHLSYRTDSLRATPSSGAPVRISERVMRIWVAPWEDKDGDLHDQSYVWVTVVEGRWDLEHTKRRVREAYRPVLAPPKDASGPAPGADGAAGLRTVPVPPGSTPGPGMAMSIRDVAAAAAQEAIDNAR